MSTRSRSVTRRSHSPAPGRAHDRSKKARRRSPSSDFSSSDGRGPDTSSDESDLRSRRRESRRIGQSVYASMPVPQTSQVHAHPVSQPPPRDYPYPSTPSLSSNNAPLPYLPPRLESAPSLPQSLNSTSTMSSMASTQNKRMSVPLYATPAQPIAQQYYHSPPHGYEHSNRGHKRTHSAVDRSPVLTARSTERLEPSPPLDDVYVAAATPGTGVSHLPGSMPIGNMHTAMPSGSPPNYIPHPMSTPYLQAGSNSYDPHPSHGSLASGGENVMPSLPEHYVLSPVIASHPSNSPHYGTPSIPHGVPAPGYYPALSSGPVYALPLTSEPPKKHKRSQSVSSTRTSSTAGKENRSKVEAQEKEAAYEEKILEKVYEKELRGMVNDALAATYASGNADKAAEQIAQLILRMAAELEITEVQTGVADVLASVARDAVQKINEAQGGVRDGAEGVIRSRIVARFSEIWKRAQPKTAALQEGKNLAFLLGALSRTTIITARDIHVCIRVLLDSLPSSRLAGPDSKANDLNDRLVATHTLFHHCGDDLYHGAASGDNMLEIKKTLWARRDEYGAPGSPDAKKLYTLVQSIVDVVDTRLGALQPPSNRSKSRTRENSALLSNCTGDKSHFKERRASRSPSVRTLDKRI